MEGKRIGKRIFNLQTFKNLKELSSLHVEGFCACSLVFHGYLYLIYKIIIILFFGKVFCLCMSFVLFRIRKASHFLIAGIENLPNGFIPFYGFDFFLTGCCFFFFSVFFSLPAAASSAICKILSLLVILLTMGCSYYFAIVDLYSIRSY